ncbi:ABC transporter ATP-binding protein [Polaromonas sp. SM01]|uniref:ABC transporter ATP-binding protein n=1 Tax=Polaromonas sp. SM01 TaxID=3085630 RepID=UPI0029811A8D|nr:ABC transporter ATP-binding protein [Polaromonas sp. SM01]MDW5444061.1 ABC transporter ATP-binding protein [Polaromonas sp. SM01]
MPAISFQSVSKNYHNTRSRSGPGVRALDDVSFDIQPGEFFGLLGPNGAGKTSLISILAGLSRASSGTVTVHGSDVVSDYANARRKLGVVPQELVFDPFFTVREALRIQSGYFGVKNNEDWIDELLASLGLADKADANMRQLSGGMKRRVLVAQALVHKPQVIVLDEPTAGVDVELRQTLWQFVAKLNKQGSTVLLTTHYLEEAEALCSRIAMLKQGRMVALAQTSELLKSASSNVLRFKIDSELPKALADKARITGRIVQLPAHNAHEIEQYLSAMREAGLVAEDVEIRKADLEDVFLEVMAEKTVAKPFAPEPAPRTGAFPDGAKGGTPPQASEATSVGVAE